MKKGMIIKRIARKVHAGMIKMLSSKHPVTVDYTLRLTENIGRNFCNEAQPKALLCYIPFDLVNIVIRGGMTHCNQLEFYQMIHYFIDRGYCLDICSYDYQGEIKTNYYDVILGFGNAFFDAREKNTEAKDVFFMTENPYIISMTKEIERLNYFRTRHGFVPKNYKYRSGRCFKQDDELQCKRIIAMGDISFLMRPNIDVQRLFPTGFSDPEYHPRFEERKMTSFLCLASDGFIHKGYDLILEVFSRHPEWKLYFCGTGLQVQAEKLKLKIHENVIDCGFVKIPSQRFEELCDECAAAVLFSCSEATSTSLLTAMRMGLVPITCRGNGFEICGDHVLFTDGFHLEEIERALSSFECMTTEEYNVLSRRIYKYANDLFNLENFTNEFYKIMDRMIMDGR